MRNGGSGGFVDEATIAEAIKRKACIDFVWFVMGNCWSIAAKLYAKLRKALDTGFVSAPEFLASGQLNELEQWFAEHILEAWYDGIYRYDGSEIRVTFEGALMWDAVEGIVPVQGLSDAEYGYWGKRPDFIEIE